MVVPVLYGVKGESAEIVETANAGLVFRPEDRRALFDRLIQLKDASGLHAQLAASGVAAAKQFDRAELAIRILAALEMVTTSGRSVNA